MRARAAALLLPVALVAVMGARRQFDLPELPAPEGYGNLLLDRVSSAAGAKPVAFSHWSHRLRYTCRVCHSELEFALSRGETGVTEAANREGRFCGACHNGTLAFGHTEDNCKRCHSGSRKAGATDFSKLKRFPRAPYGNRVDWTAALAGGLLKPADSLAPGYQPMAFDSALTLEAEWNMIPPAVFPHAQHVAWLDCASCHPEPFNIQKKTTKHFEMKFILERKFCGVCHLDVAFPLDDCKRCHPAMRE